MRSLAPQNISKTVWYYEDRRSLDFFVEVRADGKFLKCERFRVRASKLIDSLRRMGVLKTQRAKTQEEP